MKIQLEYPIQAHGETISEIELPDRGKAKHMRGMPIENMSVDDVLDFISRTANIPKSSVDEIDFDDLTKVLAWAERFFANLGSRKRRREPRRK